MCHKLWSSITFMTHCQCTSVSSHYRCTLVSFVCLCITTHSSPSDLISALINIFYLTFYVQSYLDWIGLCSVLRPCQHSIGYMGDGFYRWKDPTNSIKVLKEKAVKENNMKNKEITKYTCIDTQKSSYLDKSNFSSLSEGQKLPFMHFGLRHIIQNIQVVWKYYCLIQNIVEVLSGSEKHS